MAKRMMRLFTEAYSRKWIATLTGRFSKAAISRPLIPVFSRMYQIPIHEAEKELADYKSLNDFFTRRLKEGHRPVDASKDALTSPVDALITAMGTIQSGTLLNVKGQNYTIDELLNFSPRLEKYKHGFFFVLYLSPTDYHRIHAPVTGQKLESEYVKGRVYPVNDFGLRHMRTVLSRNARLITYIDHSPGEVAIVKVGAMNVSSIKYTNEQTAAWTRGEEMAYFEFGSTVVLLCETGSFQPLEGIAAGDTVKVGQLLGLFVPAKQPALVL